MTPITFGKSRHTNKIAGFAVATIGLLPGWLSVQTYVDLHQYMERDPSIGPFVAKAGAIALVFFGLGLWLAIKPQRVGLDLRIDAEGIAFKQKLYLRRAREGVIRWSAIEKIVYEDAPRVGASLQFFDRNAAADWHKHRLALKVVRGNFQEIFAAMENSAAASGLRLVVDKNLPLLVYDRRVYRLEPLS